MSHCKQDTHHISVSFLRFYLFLALILSGHAHSLAQRPEYTIHATLHPDRHQLVGDISIRYTNHASKPLDSLGIHLWPNAYQDRGSALNRQMLRSGHPDLHWAEAHERGGLTGLHFRAQGKTVTLIQDTNDSDIGWLHLPSPLLPGETIVVNSPFVLTIPISFSRLGRTADGAYQFTQWYPHIAVFSDETWHTMPYLDHGEFFNDFADYNVQLKVPSRFMVASTGMLMDSSTTAGITSWMLKAENVIDFAWFASPSIHLHRGEVLIGGSTLVKLNVYTDETVKDEWRNAYTYAERALKFYSDWLGPYPYPQMSVVSTPLSQAGYMEYPMLAQIAYTSDTALLDIAIAHEIGHTWLYGILANNERAHPWMDEGLNTFLEKEYTAQFQPGYQDQYLPSWMSRKSSMPQADALQHAMRFNGELEPPVSDPEFQSQNQYYFSAYHIPAQGLGIMKSMVGHDKMKSMFRAYFNQHHFTHVSPEDLRQSFESTCECNLQWFFETWLNKSHDVDYRIVNLHRKKKELTIENYSGVEVPFRLLGYEKNKTVLQHWVHGFKGTKIFHLDRPVDKVSLYDDFMMVNTRWRRNIRPRPFFPGITLWPQIGSYSRSQISVTPVAAYTLADGGMAGAAIITGLLPQRNLKLFLAPLYSWESQSMRGTGEIRYIGNIRRSIFDKFLLSISGSHFAYHQDTHYLFRDEYIRLSPQFGFRIRPSGPLPRPLQWWLYRYVDIDQDFHVGINFQEYLFADTSRRYGIHELSWQMRQSGTQRPFTIMANVQTGKGFVRLNARYKQHFAGKTRGRGVWMHGFAGWLPWHDRSDAYVTLTINGLSSTGFSSQDYMYDEWMTGRNAGFGLAARQVFEKDANLKTLATFGLARDWMFGGGIEVALPFKVIHAYMDAALYPSLITRKQAFTYSGGLAIILQKDVFEIYIPVLESRDIRESLTYVEKDQWFDRISFQAQFKFFHPLNLADKLQLGF